MADTFGLKIGLEGEKEFKKALTEINQSFKVLGSEMKLVESQFSKNDRSVESLAARNQVLNKEIEAQKQKIETLKSALANAAESFGENDRRTQAWQIQLNNAQAALNGMERELADNESAMDALGKEMDDTGDSADDLEEELDDAGDAADDSEGKFSKLGGTLKTVGVAKGIRSSDMGLRIQSKNVFSAPEYEVDFLSIPGRDGDLIAGNGRFPNIQVTYSVFLPAKSISELARKITAVKAWLYSDLNSYHTLSDTYDTDFFRYGVFATKLDIEDEMNRIGVFTVSFSCKPFRYSEAGQQEVSLASGDVLVNPYPFISRPVLRIEGNKKGTLTIQSENSNATWNFTAIDGYVEVDSEQMNFYKDAEPKNDTVSGDGFPLLYSGENTISFDGGITAVKVIPRWCCL